MGTAMGLSRCLRKAETQVTEDKQGHGSRAGQCSLAPLRQLPAEGDPVPGRPQAIGPVVTPTFRASKSQGGLSLKAPMAGTKFQAQTSPTRA